MVVFEDGAAKRSEYRRFGIRHTGGQDDFRSLAEAVTRRFERHRRVDEDGYDRSFATLPNLLVIDGGKGQLGAALDAMRSFDLPRVAVVSLAKREEEVYLPGRGQPVLLPRESPGLQLLQQVRDEAHRFALRGHRTRRAAGQTASLLDTLPGVGNVRRRALIAHFGDVARLLEASRSELEAVPGRARGRRARDLRPPAPRRRRRPRSGVECARPHGRHDPLSASHAGHLRRRALGHR